MSFNAANIGKVIYSLVNNTIPAYPVIAPQNTPTPYLVYNILNNDVEHTKDMPAWVDRVTVLVSIFESTYALASIKGTLVRELIDNMNGVIGTVAVNSIMYITETDAIDFELKYYVKTQEYLFRLNNRDGNNVTRKTVVSALITYNYASAGLMFKVPAGYTLSYFIIMPIDFPFTLHIGTTTNGNDLVNKTYPDNAPSSLMLNFYCKADQPIYISSPDWSDDIPGGPNNDIIEIIHIYEPIY